MNIRWFVYKGPHGLMTDPILQYQNEKGEWIDVPTVIIKSDKHYHENKLKKGSE